MHNVEKNAKRTSLHTSTAQESQVLQVRALEGSHELLPAHEDRLHVAVVPQRQQLVQHVARALSDATLVGADRRRRRREHDRVEALPDVEGADARPHAQRVGARLRGEVKRVEVRQVVAVAQRRLVGRRVEANAKPCARPPSSPP